MNYIPLLLQLIGGAVGGNAAGAVAKNSSLGGVGNTIAGALGGGVGMQILGPLLGLGGAAAGGGLDIGTILSGLLGGGVTGGIVQLIVGMLKKRMG